MTKQDIKKLDSVYLELQELKAHCPPAQPAKYMCNQCQELKNAMRSLRKIYDIEEIRIPM